VNNSNRRAFMVNFVRRSKDPYSWSYHNDLIAALSHNHNLRYHISLGVGAEFDIFLEEFYRVCPKHFSPILFLSAAETEAQLPTIGVITPEFSMLRVIEHPLAKEFMSFIPWTHRETFFSMQRLIVHTTSYHTLPELYKNIEDLRWVNHKLARRSMLEDIVQQLSFIKLNQFWEAIHSEIPLGNWLGEISEQLILLKSGHRESIRLPLPCNENYFIPAVIFWLQLLESVLKNKYRQWKAYWTVDSLLFMSGAHTPENVMSLFEPPAHQEIRCEPYIKLCIDPEITLIRLLSCWGETLKLQ
jgi:hypothetical protein